MAASPRLTMAMRENIECLPPEGIGVETRGAGVSTGQPATFCPAGLPGGRPRRVPVTAKGVVSTYGETLDEMRDALREQGVPVRTRHRTGWQAHSPGRT